MKYVITGGCGFIGSHLVEEILAREADAQVVVFDNLRTGRLENLAAVRDRFEVVVGDIRDVDALSAVMAGVDGVFHEAALVSVFESVDNPRENHEINLTGTLNVLQAARENGVRRLVFAASSAAYGNQPQSPKREDMRPEPESPYALAKVGGEHYLSLFAKLYGLETVALRYFNVYGPRQDPSSMYSGVISKFFDALGDGETPTIYGDGEQTRDFVCVKDVARANCLAMQSPNVGGGEVINIATGQATSLLTLLTSLGEILGHRVEPRFAPARAGDVRHSLAAVDTARKRLAFEARYSLREGLELLAGGENGGC